MNTTSLLPWRRRSDEDNGFVQLQQAMNELLETFSPLAELPAPPLAGNGRTWNPRLDLAETEKDLTVTVELPGLGEKDIDVSLSGDLLVVKGEKRNEKEEKNKTFHRIERSWGSFQRTVELPCEVKREALRADFNKGVLTITLPKAECAKEACCKIPVKTTG